MLNIGLVADKSWEGPVSTKLTFLTCVSPGILASLIGGVGFASDSPNFVAGTLIELNDNGAWSWFMDERAIVNDGKLVVGSIRAVGECNANLSDPNWGNLEIAVYDIETGRADKRVVHSRFEQDDHDVPAFMVLPDGRYLAVYSRHAVERRVYYRFSDPGDPLSWNPARMFETHGSDKSYGGDNVTYSNLFRTADGRILNIHRGFEHDPNYMYSDDDGIQSLFEICVRR
jgi:hypothetical protein